MTDGKPGEWIELKTITDVSVRELSVELESGKVYQFVVTATNEIGESLKENGKIKTVKASQSMLFNLFCQHSFFNLDLLSIVKST